MKQLGTVTPRHARDIESSKLSIGFECLDRELFNPELCYDPVGKLGVKYARCQTGWSRCEKTRGEYDFSWLDHVVDRLIDQGVQPWFNVGFGNRLYMPGVGHESAVGHVPVYYGEEAVQAWINYLKALTTHFSSRVTHYEIWNEPNLKGFWAPMPEGKTTDPESYVKLIRVSHDAIKAVQVDAQILACTSFVPLRFIQDCLVAGMGDLIDILALHPYGGDKDVLQMVENTRRLLDRYSPQVKLWQGERGMASRPGGHVDVNQKDDTVTEDKQAKSIIKRTIIDLTTEFELSSYFHMVDFMENPYRQSGGEAIKQPLFGLLNGNTYTPKKSYHAYQNLCAIFTNETEHAPHPVTVTYREEEKENALVNALIWSDSFRCNGYPLFAYHASQLPEENKDLPGTLTLVTLADQTQSIEEPVLIDLMDGAIYALSFTTMEWWQEQIYPGDQMLTGLPLKDYTLLITDRRAIRITPQFA